MIEADPVNTPDADSGMVEVVDGALVVAGGFVDGAGSSVPVHAPASNTVTMTRRFTAPSIWINSANARCNSQLDSGR